MHRDDNSSVYFVYDTPCTLNWQALLDCLPSSLLSISMVKGEDTEYQSRGPRTLTNDLHRGIYLGEMFIIDRRALEEKCLIIEADEQSMSHILLFKMGFEKRYKYYCPDRLMCEEITEHPYSYTVY